MPQFFTASATQVSPLGPLPAVVTNTGGGTLYVGGPSVTSSSNNLSIATGVKRTVPAGAGNDYCIASAAGGVMVEELPAGIPDAADAGPMPVFTDHWPLALSTGTDSTPSATEVYFKAINIPVSCTLTGVQYLIGSVGGTDKAIVVLYDDKGNVLANSALAGVTVGTANTVQKLPFTTPYKVVGPGKYHLGLSMNGTTARLRSQTSGIFGLANKATAQTFGTLTAITPPTAATDIAFVGATY